MTYLKKEDVFFERDENGELLPIEVALDLLPNKPLAKVTPMTKGELSKVVSQTQSGNTDIDTDIDIVIKHCKDPMFTEEDRDLLKTASKAVTINAIAIAIFSVSTGVTQEQIVEEGKKRVGETQLENFQKP